MDNCCKPGLDIHPALGIVFEGFPLKLQRSWGWRSNTTSISFQKISHWMLGCLLKHFYNVICLTFKHRSRTIDIHILYLNGFKDRYGWTITCVIAWAKVARTMKHLLWLWNMAKWSRKWKNRESAIHILFLPKTGLPNDWHYQRQKEIAKMVSPKLWLLNALSLFHHRGTCMFPPGRFDRRVTVGLPDVKGRAQILEVHIRFLGQKPLKNKPLLGGSSQLVSS